MADEQDVTVEFGAKIDKLIDAVDQVNKKLGEVGDHARKSSEQGVTGLNQLRFALQGLENPIRGVRDSLGELGELFTIGFGVERIAHFVETMAQLGAQTQRTSQQLGLSTENIGNLGALATVSGTSLEGLALSIERISLNVQRARTNAFDPAAQGLQVLGLKAKDLVGIPTEQYFNKLADAVSKFNPSLNLTNALMAVGGRGVAQLIPLLLKGSEGFKEFQHEVEATGAIMSAQLTQQLSNTDDRLTLLSLSLRGFGLQMMTTFGPTFDAVIEMLKDFVQWATNASKAGGSLQGIMYALAFVAKTVATGLASIVVTFQALAVAVQSVWDVFEGRGQKAIGELEASMTKAVENFKKTLQSLWGDTGSTLVAPIRPKGNADALDTGAQQRINAQRIELEGQRQLLQERFSQMKLFYDQQVSLERISAAEGVRLTAAAAEQEYTQEVALLEKERALYGQKTAEYAKINAELARLQERHNTEMLRLNFQQVSALKQQYESVLSSIQTAWDSQLRGLLAGTTSWAQAWKNILGDLIIEFIKWGEKKLVVYLAGEAAEKAAAVSGAAAKVAAADAGEAATLPLRVAAFTDRITASAAETFAGLFAFLAPFMGPAAAGPAAAGQATVLAQLAAVPKFEMGTDYVPRTGLAIVHEGEKITPASQNRPGASGGDTHLHFHGALIDGAGVAKFFKDNAPMIQRAVRAGA